MEKNEKKKKNKFRIGSKRSLSVTLVAALLVGTSSFVDIGPKAQAAEYTKIVSVEPYASDYSSGGMPAYEFKLDDGRSMHLNMNTFTKVTVAQAGLKKVRHYAGDNQVYITDAGELYQGSPPTKKLDGVKDFEAIVRATTFNPYSSYFALMENETVMAFGRGTEGQLGIGSKIDKIVPTEVADPATGDPLEGVKKIFSISIDSVILVTNNKVYLVGYGFGKSSLGSGSPVEVTDKFPAFTNASQFDMKALEGLNYTNDPNHSYNESFVGNRESSRRVFTVNGQSLSFTNFSSYDYRESAYGRGEISNSATLFPFPTGIKVENLRKMASAVKKLNSYSDKNVSTGYFNLDNGNLEYFGTPLASWNAYQATYSATKTQVATGVSKVWASMGGTAIFSKPNGYLYGWGTNSDGLTGTQDRMITTPIRLTGPSNEIKNIKDFGVMGWGANRMFALRDDNSMLTWNSTGAVTVLPKKYLAIFNLRPAASMESHVYAIDEDGKFGYFDSYLNFNPVNNAPTIYPSDYVAPIVAPDKPVLSIASKDKFNQSVVTINYGSTGDIATKQYQINGGGWLDYTGDIVVTQSGNITIQARSADSKGNISEIGELTLTSDPIVITAGHPKIDKIAADEFKISADTTGNVKVQVRVDGAAWQDFNTSNNLVLTPGDHAIEIRLLNDRDQELINKTFNVTAENPTPVIVGKPSVTQKGLNSQFGLDIEISYDASEGEALYSIDGGQWIVTTGSFSVSNAAHTIQAKVVTAAGKESEVTEFTTTVAQPKITVNADQVSIDLGINTSDVTVHYKDNNNQWVEYTGPVNFNPGTHNIEIEVRDNTGTPVFNGGPYTVTVTDPNPSNPGDGGTTPPVDPGPATPISDEEVDFTVHSGGLSSRFEGIDLSTIVIDSTNPYQQINSVSNAFIDDSTGRAGGWQYSLQITDFVSEPMYDSSTQEKGLVVSIPTNSFSVNVGSTKTLAGPENQLSNVGKKVFSTEAQVLALANPFEGMGYYQIPLNFTLSVPDRVKVVKSSDGSKYAPGQDTGLMAGVYKSTFTFTLTSGI
ncbi:MAG: hypothetical protein ACE3L7_32760 [Candidatus Pristimantibacillus sp.]